MVASGHPPAIIIAMMANGTAIFPSEGMPTPHTITAWTDSRQRRTGKFERQVSFVRNPAAPRQGLLSFFATNEWGAGPDYHLNPSKKQDPVERLGLVEVAGAFGPQNRARSAFTS
eukprot:5591131-Prymnesium_polylepis.1